MAFCAVPGLTFGQQSIDGSGNNLANPTWGAAGIELLRKGAPDYGDGVSTPAGATRPSAREVSNGLALQLGSMPNDSNASDMVWQWGQFLDHDLDLSPELDGTANPGEVVDIDVPAGDAFFDVLNTGTEVIHFTRSIFAAGSNPREQLNDITAYIDASNVYGSDTARANELRRLDGSGKLKTSQGELLPFNFNAFPNAQLPGSPAAFFLAGDVRANEQSGLVAMHTLFVREHNRLCDQIAAANPTFTDEDIYQAARRTVVSLMQVITYNEFLPILLGPNALPAYAGYDSAVDASINNEFSTAAYRFGHSMLSPQLLRYNELGYPIPEGNLALMDAFFNPSRILDEGRIEPLLRGLASQYAQQIDPHIIDDVRNFLFGIPGAGGLDLASLNIQRGRDHGLASYNAMRVDYGLAPRASFADVTSDTSLQAALASTYTDVDDIDAWVGGLCEDHVPGALVGELVYTVLLDQFTRLRDGDRFYYENVLTGTDLTDIANTTLADVIVRNTNIVGIAEDVFRVTDFSRGDCNQDSNVNIADGIRLLDHLFTQAPQFIGCEDACDNNDDGTLDISDVIALITYLFQSGTPFNAPFLVCGPDPTADSTGCYVFDACP